MKYGGLTVLSKRAWERDHGRRPMNPAFALLGWAWTPARCSCGPGHVISTSSKTMGGRPDDWGVSEEFGSD